MKFCYVDESLDNKGKLVQVMVGIVADAHRLSRSRQEFAEIFDLVSGVYPMALRELKGSRIFYGLGAWRKVTPDIRKAVFRLFCAWISDRKHHLALSAIDISRFNAGLPGDFPNELNDLWVAGAVHVALQLQKAHQTLPKNKGQTVLIFDENKVKADKLNEVLFAPPSWTESYYNKQTAHEPLDQIIDSAFFTKSHHAGLVQVSDLFAFVFRRYAELTEYGGRPKYKGELKDIQGLVDRLMPRLLGKSHRWPASSKNKCAQAFLKLAPACLAGR